MKPNGFINRLLMKSQKGKKKISDLISNKPILGSNSNTSKSTI